jgi:hypothetical protein
MPTFAKMEISKKFHIIKIIFFLQGGILRKNSNFLQIADIFRIKTQVNNIIAYRFYEN